MSLEVNPPTISENRCAKPVFPKKSGSSDMLSGLLKSG